MWVRGLVCHNTAYVTWLWLLFFCPAYGCGLDRCASALAPSSGSRETTVTVEARLRVESDGGDVLARATASDTAPVTIERDSVDASEYGSVGGSGSLTIETG